MSSPSEELPPEDVANRLESFALAVIFSAISVALLASIGIATRHGNANADWWTLPALAPATALIILAVANLITLWRDIADLRRNPPSAAEKAEGLAKLRLWIAPLEFLAYFAIYLLALQHIGYFPATLLFIIGLMLRVGLRTRGWLLAGVLTAIALIAIFRAGLGVWMPSPELYDAMPEPLRSWLLRWF